MISYIVPALNEERTIGKVVESIRKIDKEGEIIVVDSNSVDQTANIARSLGAKIVNESRLGYGFAYSKGFSAATGDVIATLDADGTYPVDEIPRLLDYMKRGYDFVSGERLANASKEAMIPMHKAGNIILNIATKILFMVNVRDSQSGMWLFKKEILKDILPEGRGMEFSEEIKIKAACRFCFTEVEINYKRRMGEKKLKPWKDGIGNLLFLLRLRASSGLRTGSFKCSRSEGQ